VSSAVTLVLAAFPSPDRGVWHLGPIPIRAYALCIIAGIVVAVLWGERRFVARGGEPGTVTDVAVFAVPFGLVGGRLYHVLTDWQTYFGPDGNPIDALKIWQGGLGIWGAVALGAVGAWIGCRRRGVPLPFFADAVAPGIVAAQAIGRLGNWFNQELYGGPTTLPWGLEIYRRVNPETGAPDSLGGVALDHTPVEIVHPTFLYELLWNLLVAALVVWADRRFRLGHGRAFAVYVAGYTAGRFWIEQMRTDYATRVFGDLRINVVVAAVVFVAAVLYLVLVRKPREEPPAPVSEDRHRDEAVPVPVGAAVPSSAEMASVALEKVVRSRPAAADRGAAMSTATATRTAESSPEAEIPDLVHEPATEPGTDTPAGDAGGGGSVTTGDRPADPPVGPESPGGEADPGPAATGPGAEGDREAKASDSDVDDPDEAKIASSGPDGAAGEAGDGGPAVAAETPSAAAASSADAGPVPAGADAESSTDGRESATEPVEGVEGAEPGQPHADLNAATEVEPSTNAAAEDEPAPVAGPPAPKAEADAADDLDTDVDAESSANAAPGNEPVPPTGPPGPQTEADPVAEPGSAAGTDAEAEPAAPTPDVETAPAAELAAADEPAPAAEGGDRGR
jgi:prolipoprotein diacylglyceryl transferase